MSLLFAILLASPAIAQPSARERKRVCGELLSHIYKDITLKNMELSLKRLNNKMVLAFIAALQNSEERGVSLRKNPELLSLFESMKKIDPGFERQLRNHGPYRSYKFWDFLPFAGVETKDVAYQEAVSKWRRLQKQSPELFEGLNEEHLLDDWDQKSADLLNSYALLKPREAGLKAKMNALGQRFRKNYHYISGGVSEDYAKAAADTKKKADDLNRAFNEAAKDLFWQNLNDYRHVCELSDINAALSGDSLACPYVDDSKAPLDVSRRLGDMAKIIGAQMLNASPRPERKPANILPYRYENVNHKGSYCQRDPKLADTAIIHHSGTDEKDTPQDLHNLQVVMHENDRDSRGRPAPWYMIAYNYIVQTPYEESASRPPRIYRGRPDNMKGAHAGAYVNMNQVDPEVRKLLKDSDIKCGWNTDKDPDHTLDKIDARATAKVKRQIRSGLVSANITSVGVMVSGNYAPDLLNGSLNPGGYPADGPPRYPTDSALRESARLLCKLRSEKYPNLRKIADHNHIKIKKAVADGKRAIGTCCPGTVYKRMNRLLELTREECPEYDFALDLSPEDRICAFLKTL